MDKFWFLPTHGDQCYPATLDGSRQVTGDYLKQVAQTAMAHFDSVGQQRMSALHDGRRDRLIVSPILPIKRSNEEPCKARVKTNMTGPFGDIAASKAVLEGTL